MDCQFLRSFEITDIDRLNIRFFKMLISQRRERLEVAKRSAEAQREKEEKEIQRVKRSSDDDTVDIAKRCADKTSQYVMSNCKNISKPL